MLVKAIACELPVKRGLPLSRFSCRDIAREVERSGLVATISDKTVWRWLSEDAVRPWQHRCWIFPRDPDFAAKAGRILDLYARRWCDKPLGRNDFVISTDEKTSIQARRRIHPTLPPEPGRPMRVEHEYERCGAWAYLAAMDVQRKVLTPNDFASLAEIEDRLLRFQEHYERIATPFEWKFTRADLDALLLRCQPHELAIPLRRAA